MIGDFFQMPESVRSFMGHWLELPVRYRWCLGTDNGVGRLGFRRTLGAHVWTRQHKFRVEIGSAGAAPFQRLLPGGAVSASWPTWCATTSATNSAGICACS